MISGHFVEGGSKVKFFDSIYNQELEHLRVPYGKLSLKIESIIALSEVRLLLD